MLRTYLETGPMLSFTPITLENIVAILNGLVAGHKNSSILAAVPKQGTKKAEGGFTND